MIRLRDLIAELQEIDEDALVSGDLVVYSGRRLKKHYPDVEAHRSDVYIAGSDCSTQ